MTHSLPTDTPQGRADKQDTSPKTSTSALSSQCGGEGLLGHLIWRPPLSSTSPPGSRHTILHDDAAPTAPASGEGCAEPTQSKLDHLAALALVLVKYAAHQPALRLLLFQVSAIPQSQAPTPARVQGACCPRTEPGSSPRNQQGLGLGAGRKRGGGPPRVHETGR